MLEGLVAMERDVLVSVGGLRINIKVKSAILIALDADI